MEIRPIRTEDDYKAALREVSAYFDNEPTPGTTDGDRFEILLTLVQAYESTHYPIPLFDPVEATKFRIDQAGQRLRASGVLAKFAQFSPDFMESGRNTHEQSERDAL